MRTLTVRDLAMTYRVPIRPAGLTAALRSLFNRQYKEVMAVKSIRFELDAGEVVGFIGPNGAGKTTTLKMLSGVLHPTAGSASVLGHTPWLREYRYLRQMAMVRGSRPIGVPGELTVLDALQYQQVVYEVGEADFRRSVAELSDMLELGPLLRRQVRALSLGERMRAGLAWSLLYRPRILFLDEPTIGLDVAATAAMRRFIADYSRHTGATVLLTSHYMADVEALCERVILINEGTLVYDGALGQLGVRLAPYRLVRAVVAPGIHVPWHRFGEVVEEQAGRAVLRMRPEEVPKLMAQLLAQFPVSDLTVGEPPLEHVIAQIYREGIPA